MRTKKITAWLLIIILLMGFMPQGVLAADDSWWEGDYDVNFTTIFRYRGSGGDLVIPKTEVIYREAFRNRDTIQSVVLPNNLMTIGTNAFSNCDNLKTIVVPDSTKYIQANAFGQCTQLAKVVLGDSVEFLGTGAFQDCTSLKTVVFMGNVPPTTIEYGLFLKVPAGLKVIVPYGTKNAYEAALSGQLPAGSEIVAPVAITSLTVKTPPTIINYTEGEALDLSGFVVTLNKSDGSSEDVSFADLGTKGITISPMHGTILTTNHTKVNLTVFNSTKTAEQTIAVKKRDLANSFTDENFREAVRIILHKSAREPIYDTDVSKITTLDVRRKNISSLAGIEYFTGLKELYCHYNQLTTLDLRNLTNLEILGCINNQLTTLNLSGLSKLRLLMCSSNQLTTLNVNGLTGLQELYCDENQLTTLNIQGLNALRNLYCIYNNMTKEADVTYLNKGITTGFTYEPQNPSGFKSVTNIAGVPSEATVGIPLTLTGTVTPSDATNTTIVWRVQNAGSTGSTISGNTLSCTAAGTVTVTATIAKGFSGRTDYTRDFIIIVSPAPVVDIDAIISPTSINYDLNTPADVITTVSWNSASTVTDVAYGTTTLITPDVYVVSGSALTIKSSYINTLGISECDAVTFQISFDKGASATLAVNIVDSYSPATNANLNGLTVNGSSVSGFDPNITVYNVALPYDTTSVSVGAVPEDAHASVAVTQAQALPSDATVVVTAEDKLTTKSYTIHFTLEAAPANINSVTVESGGNGTVSANVYSASKGTEIILTTTPDSGYFFKEWQVVGGGVLITENKFTMPDNNVTMKAIFEQIPATAYQVTINSSYATTSGAGSYSSGNIVTVDAGSRSNYTFNGWTSTDGITFANASSTTTTFIMPESNVTITASWGYSGGSGGDSDGGGYAGSSNDSSTTEDSDTTEEQQEIKPDQPTIESAVIKAKKGTDNSATAEIPENTVANAIAKAKAEATEQEKSENGIGISLSVNSPTGTKSLEIVLPQPTLTQLTKAEVASFEIDGSLGSLNFDYEAIKEIQKQSTGDVTINITPVTGLSGGAKTLVGTRPVYNITISYVKDGKTVNITSLGSGSVSLSIPYTPGKNEAVGYLFGVYVDVLGNATRIEGSTYDANSKSIIFGSNHFSVYGVGYTAPREKFKDISSHWAKEFIDYVVSQGLFSGTSTTAFSPDAAMSRGILATALGRMAGVDVNVYKTVSFTDVAADKYYTPYIEWAYKNGVLSGIGNGQFAPDRAITREEIALILTNYAKATGYTLPVTREATVFTDGTNIQSAYKEAVKAIQQAGIMMGGSGNNINPGVNTTRAEVAAMLHRYIKLTIDPATAQGWTVNDAGQRQYYKDGKALTGWQNIGSGDSVKRYYFTKDAIMVSGKWLEINSKWYYFNPDGTLAVSTKIGDYEVDKKGVRKTKS